MKERLPSHVFDLPVQELRRGYRSDIYFWRHKVALERSNRHPRGTMQVFQKKDAVLCGVDEALAILKLACGRYTDENKAYACFDRFIDLKRRARELYLTAPEAYVQVVRERAEVSVELDGLWASAYEDLVIDALHDGDRIAPWEPVLHITGDISSFAHLETIYLGVMARRTRVATNVHNVVSAANGKTVLYFPARFDHWAVQGGDGYAASVGGVHGVSTDAQGEWWGASAVGTVPHAMIAALGGDTVGAVRLFSETYPDVNLVALVDFDNDCIGTALQCAEAMGEKLWGVRVDTSENMVDRSIVPDMGEFHPTGVVPRLVFKLRDALNRAGHDHVRIIASGGFDAEKITHFEQLGAPVDAYGVGSSLLHGHYDFTADIVRVDGRNCAKAGRSYRENPRLERVRVR